MRDFYDRYRDPLLFVWGISVLTVIIFRHVVTSPEAYALIGGAIGLPLLVEFKRGNGKGD